MRGGRGRWIPAGSLFLNVGAKPTDPWTALDVAQAARPHLQLQNTIHWIKSIAIDRDAAGAGAGLTSDLNVGHYKPINSDRFVNDCHEFIFHFTPGRAHAARPPRHRREVPGRVERRPLARRRPATCAAAATPGSSPTRPSRTATRTAPTPRRSRRECRSTASSCTGCRARSVLMDPFLGLGSSALAAAQLGVDFVGVELDRHYLDEAIARVRAALRG